MKTQSGFTLIELVIVIVLLGVLAAIAVPRFINIQGDAQRAQREATAAAISSAMNINFAGCAVNRHVVGPNCVAVANCTDAADVVQNSATLLGPAPRPFTVTAGAIAAGNGSTLSCVLTQNGTGITPAPTANFTAVRAGT